ncbi:MAG: helix-turn-helix transcriptional regulator [Lachnospiraceae bacterium]|nr:helix-turn-helix transcriptional regulator [Lachnospiraceae bacterium]
MEKKNLGTFLAALRREKGWTQKELAELLHVSDKTVSRWERDESVPDLFLVPDIAQLYGITSDELIRGERTNVEKDRHSCEKKVRIYAQKMPWEEMETMASDEELQRYLRDFYGERCILSWGTVIASLVLMTVLGGSGIFPSAAIVVIFSIAVILCLAVVCLQIFSVRQVLFAVAEHRRDQNAWTAFRREVVYRAETIGSFAVCIGGSAVIVLVNGFSKTDIGFNILIGLMEMCFFTIILLPLLNYWLRVMRVLPKTMEKTEEKEEAQ